MFQLGTSIGIRWPKIRLNFKFQFVLDQTLGIYLNFFFLHITKIQTNLVYQHNFRIYMESPWSQHYFHIASFSKLFSVSVSEFFHQITFDGKVLLARPDTLSYIFSFYMILTFISCIGHSKTIL